MSIYKNLQKSNLKTSTWNQLWIVNQNLYILYYVLHSQSNSMKKEVKIILYCVVAIAAITVIFLMLWFPKNRIWEPDVLPDMPWDVDFWFDNSVQQPQPEPETNHEQAILNDLENLFHSNDGYENVEWEYGFINADAQ